MAIKVAVNGFGRIGRVFTRALIQNPEFKLVAINDLADATTLAHLFKYDSIHGRFNGSVEVGSDHLIINDQTVYLYSCKDPVSLPWKDLGVDYVVESTGVFRTKELASKHLQAGARKVVLSAPAKGDDITTVVMGINDEIVDGTESIVSNASCTTNCAAPMIKVLDELCGIESGYITTVHSYTSDQRLHDAPHTDLRRARAGAMSIVPTTTGAAKAITKIFPHLHGNMGGCGIRVPVPDGSLTDITCILKRKTTVQEVNAAFKAQAVGKLKGIMEYITDPVVSIDIIGNPYSCIFDSKLTSVIGNMVKVVGWYDNEAGYSNRLVDLILKLEHSSGKAVN